MAMKLVVPIITAGRTGTYDSPAPGPWASAYIPVNNYTRRFHCSGTHAGFIYYVNYWYIGIIRSLTKNKY
jgi:hypothetical protein